MAAKKKASKATSKKKSASKKARPAPAKAGRHIERG